MNRKQHTHRLSRRTGTTLKSIGLAVVLILVLTSLLYEGAALDEDVAEKIPLPVAVTHFEEQSSYRRQVSYLGLIQARRKTKVGFEMPGLLRELKVSEGSRVQAGDILAKLDDAKLQVQRKSAMAELQQVGAELELARIKESRQQDLRNTGAVSREAHDETRLRAQALLAQSDVVQAKLDGIDIELHKSVIRAPYSGVISERYIDIGTVVSAGTPIVRLVEAAVREAHIGIAVAEAEKLVAGHTYPLTLRGMHVEARLLSVKPDVNPATRAVTAIFLLPADAGGLDGEPVSLALSLPVQMTGGWLPISALLEGERGVWTVLKIKHHGEELLVVREVVEVLEIQGDKVFVRGTIGHGDQLVADGVHRVTPGTAVTLAMVN
jgi:RND family efflux transporter MFP subunit